MKTDEYYVPSQSHWPIVGAIALFVIAFSAGLLVIEMHNEKASPIGHYGLVVGFCILIYMLYGWFKNVIHESLSGMYSVQMDRSFRQGMLWFILSEFMFFLILFGTLFYARMLSVPWLAGEGNNEMTGQHLWPQFNNVWPLTQTPNGEQNGFMSWQGLPLINTGILLVSSVTLFNAHKSLDNNNISHTVLFLVLTIVLAFIFLTLQFNEYQHAYQVLGLKLDSGIYGNTFYILTGFHGLHVTLGATMICVILIRTIKGHFNKDNIFAFQAVSWYWHFVDVIWIILFLFVYII
ncbi:MAG: cytochrome c oxidase subunit 3 [Pseudomonadales bacterium]|nr:cytochrome c oxidase subunit 3 [Pseudomonadales bacterium]